jgi:hypothetical protein
MNKTVLVAVAIIAGAALVGITTTDATNGVSTGYLMDATGRGADIKTSFETGDYTMWSETMAGTWAGEKVDEATFNKMVEARKLAQNGDFESAKSIMIDELGFDGLSRGMHFKKEHRKITPEMKEYMEQIRELKESGDLEGAEALLEELSIEHPGFVKKLGRFKGFHI